MRFFICFFLFLPRKQENWCARTVCRNRKNVA